MTTTSLPTLHTLAEVADRYRMSLRGLKDRARRRQITHIRVGNQRYLTDEQITELLAQHTITPAAPVVDQRAVDMAATAARVGRSRRGRRAAA